MEEIEKNIGAPEAPLCKGSCHDEVVTEGLTSPPASLRSAGAPCAMGPLNEELRAHFDSLCRQAEELKAQYPDFELSEALKDRDFVRLTAPKTGTDLRRAFYALNSESLEAAAERRGAEQARKALAQSLAAAFNRPRELPAGHRAMGEKPDYKALSGEQRGELKKRIREAGAKGEKLYP